MSGARIAAALGAVLTLVGCTMHMGVEREYILRGYGNSSYSGLGPARDVSLWQATQAIDIVFAVAAALVLLGALLRWIPALVGGAGALLAFQVSAYSPAEVIARGGFRDGDPATLAGAVLLVGALVLVLRQERPAITRRRASAAGRLLLGAAGVVVVVSCLWSGDSTTTVFEVTRVIDVVMAAAGVALVATSLFGGDPRLAMALGAFCGFGALGLTLEIAVADISQSPDTIDPDLHVSVVAPLAVAGTLLTSTASGWRRGLSTMQ